MLRRREFIGGVCSATVFAGDTFGADGERICRVLHAAEIGRPLPRWRPGEFDIHFICTGMGECAFYILPDGTTWLNDCGDYRYSARHVPIVPSDARTAGDWVTRYIRRVTDSRRLDYLTISHWHTDHVGAPGRAGQKTPDGRYVTGAAQVAENFEVGRYYDFEWPYTKKYKGGDVSLGMMRASVEYAVKNRGLLVEPFRVGAEDQICPVRDPGNRWAKLFHVRNLCANGVAWTGEGEKTCDFAANYVRATKNPAIDVNILSMALKLSYGPFSFFTGGDLSKWLRDSDGRTIDYEAYVGERCGPVTVCKTNHHGYVDAMKKGFVSAVRPAAYLSAVWYDRQISDKNMKFMASRELYPGNRFFFASCVPPGSRTANADCPWWQDFAPEGHAVVRVAPGGATYRIFTLTPVDESMTVTSVFEGVS